jgi:hypothetical protein
LNPAFSTRLATLAVKAASALALKSTAFKVSNRFSPAATRTAKLFRAAFPSAPALFRLRLLGSLTRLQSTALKKAAFQ